MNINVINAIDWVRHGESCANIGTTIADKFDFEPNLSFLGMEQAIYMGKKYLSNQEQKYDVVVCSAMTRTIMTALLSNRYINLYKPTKIYVLPYINEDLNPLSFMRTDYQNTAVKSVILKKRISFIKDWLESNWLNCHIDIEIKEDLVTISKELLNLKENKSIRDEDLSHYEFIRSLISFYIDIPIDACHVKFVKFIKDIIGETLKFLNKINQSDKFNKFNQFITKYDLILENWNTFIRGPIIDFTFLEKYEAIYENNPNDPSFNTLKNNIDLFYSHVLPDLVTFINVDKANILCYCHGHFIRKNIERINPIYFKNNNVSDILNTQTFRQTFNTNDFEIIYKPDIEYIKVMANVDKTSYDVCGNFNVKGYINNLKENSTNNKNIDWDANINDIEVDFNRTTGSSILTGGANNHIYSYQIYIQNKQKYAQLKLN